MHKAMTAALMVVSLLAGMALDRFIIGAAAAPSLEDKSTPPGTTADPGVESTATAKPAAPSTIDQRPVVPGEVAKAPVKVPAPTAKEEDSTPTVEKEYTEEQKKRDALTRAVAKQILDNNRQIEESRKELEVRARNLKERDKDIVNLDEKVKVLQKEIKDLTDSNREITSRWEKTVKQLDEAQTEITRLGKEVLGLTARLSSAEQSRDSWQSRADALSKERDAITKERDSFRWRQIKITLWTDTDYRGVPWTESWFVDEAGVKPGVIHERPNLHKTEYGNWGDKISSFKMEMIQHTPK